MAGLVPPTGGGRVVITSQFGFWPGREVLEVPVLDRAVAAGFLLDRAGASGSAVNRPGFCGGSQSTGEWDDGGGAEISDELRDRAIRLVLDVVKDQDASVTAACRKVGGELGIKPDTLRGWAKQAQVDQGDTARDVNGGCGAVPGAGAGER